MFNLRHISLTSVHTALLMCLSFDCASAESTTWDPLRYSTLGIWASTPLELSARVGLALPLEKNSAIVAGNEFGLAGNKQFVGWRSVGIGHGVVWGGIDLAHWKTRSSPLLAAPHTDYYGVEAQYTIFRLGLMIPTEGHSPSLTAGVGFSF